MLLNFTELKTKYKANIRGIIHVGAHYGEEVKDYIDNGIQKLLLFEPLEDNYKILSNRVNGLNADIKLHKVALGSEIKEATMYVSDNEKQSSSILKPKKHLTHHPDVYFPDMENVEVNILDNYDTFEYNFISMDVQGYELEVLKGAKNSLKNIDYVYCEVNRDEVYENNALIEEIDLYLSQFGFTRVETDWSGGIWGDAFYVKEYNISPSCQISNLNDYQKCLSRVNFDSKHSPLFLDVGCNIEDQLDDFTEMFFKKYKNSNCVAIEPVFYKKYEEKWGNDSRVTLVKKALSNNSSTKILYSHPDWNGLSSFYKRDYFNGNYNELHIECLSLDDLSADLNINYIDYLKVDTEGSEFPILMGSINLLKNKKINYIQLEYGGTYKDANYTVLDVINFLLSYNYELIYYTGDCYNNNSSGELLFKCM